MRAWEPAVPVAAGASQGPTMVRSVCWIAASLALSLPGLVSCSLDGSFMDGPAVELPYDFSLFDGTFLPSNVDVASAELQWKLKLLPNTAHAPWVLAALDRALTKLGVGDVPISQVPQAVLDIAEGMMMPQYVERAIRFKTYVDCTTFEYPSVPIAEIQTGDILLSVTEDYTNMAFMNQEVPHHASLCVHAPSAESDAVFLQIAGKDHWVSLYSLQFLESFPGRIVVLRLWNEDSGVISRAVVFGLQQVGKPYNANVLERFSNQSYYCSQLIWRAYYEAGVDLDTQIYASRDFGVVLPAHLYLSPYLRVVQPHGP
jgi:hypothetical protein